MTSEQTERMSDKPITETLDEIREIVGDAFDGDLSDMRGMECTKGTGMPKPSERMSEGEIERLPEILIAKYKGERNSMGDAWSDVWINDAAKAITQLRTELIAMTERANGFEAYKIALEEAAVCDFIEDKHWSEPTQLIAAIVDFNQKVALDPAVSKEARELRDTHLSRADKAVEGLEKIANRTVQSQRHNPHQDIVSQLEGYESIANDTLSCIAEMGKKEHR